MSEPEFREEIKKFQTFFAGEVKQSAKGKLEIYGTWDSETINAYSMRDEDIFIITISGGFARAPYMTRDSFALVLCHELGHHLGGFPKKYKGHWSSAEGQADYFATSKCLKKYWSTEMNVKRKIEEASVAFIHALAHKKNLPVFPQIFTPDLTKVSKTWLEHPDYQCRLDTLIQGNECKVSRDIPFSDTDEKTGACHSQLDEVGFRPFCWFKESASTSLSGIPSSI